MTAPCTALTIAVLALVLPQPRASASEPPCPATTAFSIATSSSEPASAATGLTSSSSSSSIGCTLPDAPNAATRDMAAVSGPISQPAIHPFSTVAIALRLGLQGPGIDMAVPVSKRVNLRAGMSFFTYNPHLVEDGVDILGDIQLETAFAAVDIYPFNGNFRISPGVAYNGSQFGAHASIPGGQSFDLGEGAEETSSPTDPIHGTFNIDFGKKIAPRITMGWGNMIPRKGGHWSFPFEIGVMYISHQPQVSINLVGTACQAQGCGQVQTDPTSQLNIQQEEQEINADIPSWLRFFPVVSTGISYRFGHVTKE